MLKLFKIETTKNNDPVYFDDKRKAKEYRDRMREEGHLSTVIMRGPDHRKGESFNDG